MRVVRDLARTNLAYSLLEIALVWIVIAALFLISGKLNLFISALVMIPTITCLQQALLTLLHDSWHGLLCKNKRANDFIGKYLISFPCIKLWGRLKREHLEHHKYLGLRDSDPTFSLYAFDHEEPRNRLGRFLFNRLGGRVLGAIQVALSSRRPKEGAITVAKKDLWVEIGSIAAMQSLLVLCITSVAPFWTYIVFWCVPLFTTTAACNLIRTFCEHASPISDDIPAARRLISFQSSLPELAFIAPLHFNYHAEHHLNMSVPHYRLPELRRRMEAAGPLGFPVRLTYLEVLREHFATKSRRDI